MVDDKLVNYLKICLLRNISLNKIKEKLKEAGWTDDSISQAASIATQQIALESSPKPSISQKTTNNLLKPSPQIKQRKSHKKLRIIISIIFILILILGVLTYFIIRNTDIFLKNSKDNLEILNNEPLGDSNPADDLYIADFILIIFS
ncbi:MAG: hypothetical protein ABIH72_00950 [archaeon]